MKSASVAAIGLLAACAGTTKLTNVQVVPEQQRIPVKNVLVIGLFQDPAARQAYETEMVKRLEAAGAEARASAELFPPGAVPSREQLERLVQEQGFDGAVVGRLVDKQTETYVHAQPVFYDWYGYAYPGVYEPVVYTSETYVVETRVFETVRGQSEFAASSQSIDPRSAAEVAQQHAELVVGALETNGLV